MIKRHFEVSHVYVRPLAFIGAAGRISDRKPPGCNCRIGSISVQLGDGLIPI